MLNQDSNKEPLINADHKITEQRRGTIKVSNKDYHINLNSENYLNEVNSISTSKYTFLNCIPKILIEQFSKIANIYFLFIAILQV